MRDPPVPEGPATDLVLFQPGEALDGMEVLDGPAQPGAPISSTNTPKITIYGWRTRKS